MPSLSRPGQKRLAALVLALLVAFGTYGFFFWLEWEETEVELGFSKAAIINPFLAAQQYLEQQGKTVEVLAGLASLDEMAHDGQAIGEGDLVILVDSYGALPASRLDSLWQWLEAGGHLVISTANPYIELDPARPSPLLQRLDVAPVPSQEEAANSVQESGQLAACDELEAITIETHPQGPDFQMVRLGGGVFEYAGDNPLWHDSEPPYRSLRLRQGEGTVTLNADNNLWRNAYIGCFDHAYALALIAESAGRVWILINRDSPSLWRLVWAAAPVPVVLAGLALLLWLWASAKRFAPVVAGEAIARRSFLEHVRANAAFLWRHHRQAQLAEHLRQDFRQALVRRYPQLTGRSRVEHTALVARLAGLSAGEADALLNQPAPRQSADFVRLVNHLQYLRNRL